MQSVHHHRSVCIELQSVWCPAPLSTSKGKKPSPFSIFFSTGHQEVQPHKFAASWTTGWTDGPEKEGAFYASSHGVAVQPSANTLVTLQPHHVHGTSLHDRHPQDANPIFQRTGITFITPNPLISESILFYFHFSILLLLLTSIYEPS